MEAQSFSGSPGQHAASAPLQPAPSGSGKDLWPQPHTGRGAKWPCQQGPPGSARTAIPSPSGARQPGLGVGIRGALGSWGDGEHRL